MAEVSFDREILLHWYPMLIARFKRSIFLLLAGAFVFALLEGAFTNTSVEEELTSETELIEACRDLQTASRDRVFDGNDFDYFLASHGLAHFPIPYFSGPESQLKGIESGLPCQRLFLLFHRLVFYH